MSVNTQFLDDITICRKDQEEHDANLECFLEAAERKNITYNKEKSVLSTGLVDVC